MIRCSAGDESCAASLRGACPRAWKQWGGSCFKATDKPLTLSAAKDECIRMGSVLFMPQSEEEIKFLLRLVDSSAFWIQCSDQQSVECAAGINDDNVRTEAEVVTRRNSGLGRGGSSGHRHGRRRSRRSHGGRGRRYEEASGPAIATSTPAVQGVECPYVHTAHSWTDRRDM